MWYQRLLIDHQPYVYALLRRPLGRRDLLLAVLMGSLCYATVGLGTAGEGPMPVVEVKLTEFSIEMPTTVPLGPVTFSVTNASTVEHNFKVEGQGIAKQFDTNLRPGETRSLQVDLPAGTYTIYCPLDDHRQRGMQRELKVAQQQSGVAVPPVAFHILAAVCALSVGQACASSPLLS